MPKLRLSQINLDGGTQIRHLIDDDVVEAYCNELKAGTKFPPIVVFYDGDTYWLADGFHRFYAVERFGKKSIDCNTKKGTQRTAILYACGANAKHGFPRTNQDKRRAVETLLADDEWSQWSDVEIAKRCVVNHSFVSKMRRELSLDNPRMRPEKVKARRGDSEYEIDTTGLRRSKAADQDKCLVTRDEPDPPHYGFEEPEEVDDGFDGLDSAWRDASAADKKKWWLSKRALFRKWDASHG